MKSSVLLMLVLAVTALSSCRRSDETVPPSDGATQVQPPPEPPGMQQPSYPDRGVDTLPGSGGLPGTGTGTGGAPGSGTGGAPDSGTGGASGTGTGTGARPGGTPGTGGTGG